MPSQAIVAEQLRVGEKCMVEKATIDIKLLLPEVVDARDACVKRLTDRSHPPRTNLRADCHASRDYTPVLEFLSLQERLSHFEPRRPLLALSEQRR